ncbi:hypothetical protein D3C71_1953170 [compost metagenome]
MNGEHNIHGLAHQGADDYKNRSHKQGDLQAAANRDFHSGADFVLQGQHNGGGVLCSIAYNGDDEGAHKQLG